MHTEPNTFNPEILAHVQARAAEMTARIAEQTTTTPTTPTPVPAPPTLPVNPLASLAPAYPTTHDPLAGFDTADGRTTVAPAGWYVCIADKGELTTAKST